MTPRERLLAPFRGITPGQPAWMADLGYWWGAEATKGTLPEKYQGKEGRVQLERDLGVCSYYGQAGLTYSPIADGVESHQTDDGHSRVRTWRTPAGELADRWKYLDDAYCWAHVEYAAKTASDLKVVQDIFERRRFVPNPGNFTAASDRVGDNGLPISPAPRSPLPALLADWCGVQDTIYLIVDEPQAVRDTLAAIDRANDGAFEAACASDAELFHFCDNLDSWNSASLFDEFMGEYYTRRLRQLHDAGKYAVVHLDGAVRGLLPKLAAAGFDGVESLTPGPVGDVEIEEMREVAANEQVILWGGIPGAMFCDPWTEDDVRDQTQRWIEHAGRDGRFIVGSADLVPPDGHIEYVRAVAELLGSLS